VISALQEVDSIVSDQVHDPMLLGQPARPEIRSEMPQWLWLPDADERIADDRLDQLQQTQRGAPVGLDPMVQIVAELGL
jgi:hypothetical protein